MTDEIETVGWAILQALHEGVEEGPQSWSDMASDQEKRIKKAAIAAIEAVTDLSQYKARGFSLAPAPSAFDIALIAERDSWKAQFESVEAKLDKARDLLAWLDERGRNSTSYGSHSDAYEVAARKLREATA